MQSREEEYRKSLIDELAYQSRQVSNPNEIRFLNLKILLLKGVDESEESEKAKVAFFKSRGNPRLLAFLLYEGIFSNYKEFYECKELDTVSLMGQTAGEYIDSVPNLGMWAGALFVSAGIIGGIKGLIDAKTREPLNQPSLIEFFCNLEKIRNPGPRKVFIEMVNTSYEKAGSMKQLALFKLDDDIHAKWLNLLRYVADINNHGTKFYCTVIKIAEDKKGRQDMLGFKSLHTFFNKCDALPQDVHEVIRDKFIATCR